MYYPNRIILVIFFGFLFMMCFAQTSNTNAEGKNDSALLFRKTTRIIHSEIMQADFQIQISLPANYYKTDTVYPLLLSTDANRNFGIISDLVNALSFPTEDIPYMIVAGIGYPIAGLEEWGARRHNDLTPTYDSTASKSWQQLLYKMSGNGDLNIHSGEAEKFLLFIKEELIPWLETEYRVDKDNYGLAGYSLGGLFSIYAMLNSPGTFRHVFAGSPSLWWDGGSIFELEESYAKQHIDLDIRFFMSVGEHEAAHMVGDMKQMESRLRSRNYPNLEMETTIFPVESHQTCYPVAITRALIYLYSGGRQ